MNDSLALETSSEYSDLQRALVEHNPRVLWLSEARIVQSELWSASPPGLGGQPATAGKQASEGQGRGAENSLASAAVAVERLQPAQARALLTASRRVPGASALVSGSGETISTIVLTGPLAALEDASALLSDTRGGDCAALAAALKHVLAGYQCRTHTLQVGSRTFHLGQRTLLMGILNVTPDSFSDGGEFLAPDAAVEHGLAMMGQGADLLDIGGESTRPGALPVPPQEQLRRIAPVIKRLADAGAVMSIDTSSAEVARAALDMGAAMVNDVTALRGDPELAPLVAERRVPVVLMHMRGTPLTMAVAPTYDNLMSEVVRFLRERMLYALRAGIREEQILVDPGLGFGKTVEHNLELLRRLGELRTLGRPVLVGTSRKSFIGKVLDLPVGERALGTAATLALAVAAGAAMVRVHDVREAGQVVRMAEAVLGPRQ
jgi:dihydropteroate synthase